jgi:hypothetical protein
MSDEEWFRQLEWHLSQTEECVRLIEGRYGAPAVTVEEAQILAARATAHAQAAVAIAARAAAVGVNSETEEPQ